MSFVLRLVAIMEKVSLLKPNTELVEELTSFFDLLAKFDFEDAKKHRVIPVQEVEKGFSLAGGEPFLESCIVQDETNKLENPSSNDTEVKRSF